MSLTELPAEQRNHPLFRRGYNLGVQDQARREYLDELDNGQPLRLFRTAPRAHAAFGLASSVALDDLAEGVTVAREVRRSGPKWFTTETPCCAQLLTLPADPEAEQHAMCCHCGVTYLVDREQEESDGWSDKPTFAAVFTVERTGVASALHRRTSGAPKR